MPDVYYDEPRNATIHNYDAFGVYVGSTVKRIPRGVGLPRNSTEVVPPELSANEAARFNRDDETWEVVPDFRGEVRFDAEGERIEINDVGPMPPSLVRDKPPKRPERIQAELMQQVKGHINARAIAQGFDSMLDAVSYAEEPTDPARQALGLALRAWRSAVLLTVDAALLERPRLTAVEIVERIPAFTP